jgi:hypothetical protein
MHRGLTNPLGTVRVITSLVTKAENLGLKVRYSSDFEELVELRLKVRGDRVSPMFDPAACQLDDQRAFWVGAFDHAGNPHSLQAFRLDLVHPNLAEWAVGWMTGLYVKRHELVMPSVIEPPPHSRSRTLKGALVYHGEMWIDKTVRKREYFDTLPKIGMLIAHIKWQPDALWALTGNMFATHGYITRSGYALQEHGFLQWHPDWKPIGADESEWLIIAERSHLEYLAATEAAEVV